MDRALLFVLAEFFLSRKHLRGRVVVVNNRSNGLARIRRSVRRREAIPKTDWLAIPVVRTLFVRTNGIQDAFVAARLVTGTVKPMRSFKAPAMAAVFPKREVPVTITLSISCVLSR